MYIPGQFEPTQFPQQMRPFQTQGGLNQQLMGLLFQHIMNFLSQRGMGAGCPQVCGQGAGMGGAAPGVLGGAQGIAGAPNAAFAPLNPQQRAQLGQAVQPWGNDLTGQLRNLLQNGFGPGAGQGGANASFGPAGTKGMQGANASFGQSLGRKYPGPINPDAEDVKSAGRGKKRYTGNGNQVQFRKGPIKGGTFSPLALDINGQKGIQTTNEKINFDIDGDGKLDRVNDVKDGVLAFGAGKNGKQLFGDNTDLNGDGKADGYKNGFEALRALAKREGFYDAATGDTKLDKNEIAQLEKSWGLGIKKGYNAKKESLLKNGVTEIELGKENAKTTATQGDQRDVTLQQ